MTDFPSFGPFLCSVPSARSELLVSGGAHCESLEGSASHLRETWFFAARAHGTHVPERGPSLASAHPRPMSRFEASSPPRHVLRRKPERVWRGLGFGFAGEDLVLRPMECNPPWMPVSSVTTESHPVLQQLDGTPFPVSGDVGAPYYEDRRYVKCWDRDAQALRLRESLYATSPSPFLVRACAAVSSLGSGHVGVGC